MSKSNLINHINHLRIEINVLKNRQEERVNQKKLDAIIIYDTTIMVLKKRIEESEAELASY
tara:strand:- start:1109 stop:1291 length:183 start_codon:yes stop_codon:yes gene_type:complete